jgi:hypothetical protein
VGGFFEGLDHQHGVVPGVQAVEQAGIDVELIAQNQQEMAAGRCHGGVRSDAGVLSLPLLRAPQASEQYFTSAQFLAQLLRQTMSRPQTRQGLLGSEALLPLKPFDVAIS